MKRDEIKHVWKNCMFLYIHPDSFQAIRAENKGAARRIINRCILPLAIIATIPAFLFLWLDNVWYISVFRAVINCLSLYVGAWGVYGITCYYVTDSPENHTRESYIAPLVLNSFALFVIPISQFYAIDIYAWRYLFFIAAVYYLIRTQRAGINASQDIESNIKNNTLILTTTTTIIFPFVVQRILFLIFKLPI